MSAMPPIGPLLEGDLVARVDGIGASMFVFDIDDLRGVIWCNWLQHGQMRKAVYREAELRLVARSLAVRRCFRSSEGSDDGGDC